MTSGGGPNDPSVTITPTASGTGTLSWVDTTGNNQVTTVNLTVTAAPPANTVTCSDGSVHPAGYVCPAAPASGTTTGTSTGTIVAIGIAAVAAGGILAYALANRGRAAAPAHVTAAPASRRLPARRAPARRRR